MMTRRALLRSTAILAPAAALSAGGCSFLAPLVAAAPQIAQDAGLIASALQTILPTITTLTGLAGGAKNTITGVINEISSVASQIGSATSTTAASLVQELGGGVSTLAGMLSGVAGLPGIVSAVINDALALLPAIEAAAGIAPRAARHVGRFAAAISPDQARADLSLIVARR